MTLDQIETERSAKRVPHWKRRKVKAPQHEFGFTSETFRLIGELLPPTPPERVEPTAATELFAAMRATVENAAAK